MIVKLVKPEFAWYISAELEIREKGLKHFAEDVNHRTAKCLEMGHLRPLDDQDRTRSPARCLCATLCSLPHLCRMPIAFWGGWVLGRVHTTRAHTNTRKSNFDCAKTMGKNNKRSSRFYFYFRNQRILMDGWMGSWSMKINGGVGGRCVWSVSSY